MNLLEKITLWITAICIALITVFNTTVESDQYTEISWNIYKNSDLFEKYN